jgi:hypothetical protein
VNSPEDLNSEWPSHSDGFLAAAPYLTPNVPLNINACVFPDGSISIHGPSLQLIGLEGITNHRFGYCGNDFARIVDLDRKALQEFEETTIATGKWLHKNGYRGVFGIDALFFKGDIYLTEINPRFQGSSLVSARIDHELDRSDVFMEHIAAFLDLPAPKSIPIHELVSNQKKIAHVVCHNVKSKPLFSSPVGLHNLHEECRQIPSPDIAVLNDAITFQAILNNPVTTDGMTLLADAHEKIFGLYSELYPGFQRTDIDFHPQLSFF